MRTSKPYALSGVIFVILFLGACVSRADYGFVRKKLDQENPKISLFFTGKKKLIERLPVEFQEEITRTFVENFNNDWPAVEIQKNGFGFVVLEQDRDYTLKLEYLLQNTSPLDLQKMKDENNYRKIFTYKNPDVKQENVAFFGEKFQIYSSEQDLHNSNVLLGLISFSLDYQDSDYEDHDDDDDAQIVQREYYLSVSISFYDPVAKRQLFDKYLAGLIYDKKRFDVNNAAIVILSIIDELVGKGNLNNLYHPGHIQSLKYQVAGHTRNLSALIRNAQPK